MKTRTRIFSPVPVKLGLALLLAAAALGTLLVLVAQAAPGNSTYYVDTFLPARDVPGNLAELAPSATGPAAPANGPAFTAVVTDVLVGLQESSAAWGDYDNDGDLDILLTGHDSALPVSKIYRNDGSDTFADISAALTDVYFGSVAWGDYDNDGDLDILLTGYDFEDAFVAKIYRNDGSGTFVTAVITDTLAGVTEGSSVAWGDYDNDGDLDILLTGTSTGGGLAAAYRNDGADAFTEAITDTLPAVEAGAVAWGDYDNDGDLDVLFTGSPGAPIAHIYRNDGSDTFTAAVTDTLTGVADSSVAWGDYDNDGDLDILLAGVTGTGCVSRVYRNDGSDTFAEAVTDTLTGVNLGSVAWGDYDNDGDLDILLTGNAAAGRISRVYRNDGSDTFATAVTTDTLTGVGSGSSAAWGDYDGDGDLDILLVGYDGSGRVAIVYRNNTTATNTAPAVPSDLSAQTADDTVELSWSAPPPPRPPPSPV